MINQRESLVERGCECVCHLLGEGSTQHVLTHGLLGQREPELAGLQGHILILVLGPQQHVLG